MKANYLMDIRGVVEMADIPDDMIINWDHTAMKIVPSCSWTMEKRGTKRVEIKGIDDKRQITALFACTLSGQFLPIQLIYQGTTARCQSKGVAFPSDWHITCTKNHWSTEETMMAYLDSIIIPYTEAIRQQRQLGSDTPAIVIIDAFRRQCTDPFLKKLNDNNLLYAFVPANCTDPLDLSVNKPAKDFMKRKFQEWYSNISWIME